MNREIKFRAWRSKSKEMLTHEETLSLIMLQGRVLNGTADDKGLLGRHEIMEYTGLNDVCEDDIVKITGEGYYSNDSFSVDEEAWEFVGRVEMNSFMWMVTQKDGTWFPFVDLITEDNIEIETIGNMFESPELLP